MSELYTNGFVNLDDGVSCGGFFDDSDCFVFCEIRKFSGELDLKQRGDEVVRFLSKRLRQDLDRRKETGKDIVDLPDETRNKLWAELQEVVGRMKR